MEKEIVSTAYVPLQPPYQVIKYERDVAMQIGTLIVTVHKKGAKNYQIETHSHPVVAYESKDMNGLVNEQLTDYQFLEGAVWNNVEVRDVTTVCLTGATLTWEKFLKVLVYENMLHRLRTEPDIKIYWSLKRLGVKVLPPVEREGTVRLIVLPQPEETGLSLQSWETLPLYLNVSIITDDEERGIISHNKGKWMWDSRLAKSKEDIFRELSAQLYDYRYVLRDLLYNEEVKQFNVSFTTDDERFQEIADNLDDVFANMAYY